ncbi:MAG TPA: hypothetical protein VN706_19940 [Gemmatimonadaceae bacterium]|nr:hypothetical protein [Gemmatimonadaceae bacterium]
MHRSRFIALLLGVGSLAALAACDKNGVQDISSPTSGAYIRFFNFGVTSPGVNFYANSQKITAISNGVCQAALPTDTATIRLCTTTGIESTSGTGYNAAANGALYSELAPGQYTFAGQIAATTDHGVAVSTASATLDDAKFYSYYQTGVYNTSTKKADAFIVEDPIPTISDYSLAYVRLVNALPGSTPMVLIGNNETTGAPVTIGGPVAYKSAGTFVAVPAGVYDLSATQGTVAVPSLTAVSFVGGHVYSVAARGDYQSTVTANKPGLTSTANR